MEKHLKEGHSSFETLEDHIEYQSSIRTIHIKDHHISKIKDLKNLAHPKKGYTLESFLGSLHIIIKEDKSTKVILCIFFASCLDV